MAVTNMNLPILYSFRRCPYAMRARIGFALAGVDYIVREVDLKNKPKELYAASSKATVPVLVAYDLVVDESLDILYWLRSKECFGLNSDLADFVEDFRGSFITVLNHFKYPDRYSDVVSKQRCQEILLVKLRDLDSRLKLMNAEVVYEDEIIIFPFVRQLRLADADWFSSLGLGSLYSWVGKWEEVLLKYDVMVKHEVWQRDSADVIIKHSL